MSPFAPAPLRRSSRSAPWTDAEAARVLAAAHASGLSLYRFARQHGLRVTQLYWWRERLAHQQPVHQAAALAFVPVVAAVPSAAEPVITSGLELAVGVVTVRIAPDFCAATLERLLPILAEMASC
jgi:transposase-like protein